ncbi:MAG TPA: SAM-dependent chlorinase/fluorinase [Thermoanaerobaculia bacterium]|nr:SAM-dependent chlorinase/fluorinase [Thermoanaerobaculia bacterium]
MMPLLTLLTDFGTRDWYVAAVKGVVLRLAPGAGIVDVTHEVAPGDVEGGAFLWNAAVRWFPDRAVHLAVVDPGVGGTRRILAARAPHGFLLAPDNGLLTPFLDQPGLEVRAVAREELFLPGPGATFHGRDRFAPVAAWLLRGEPFAALGPVVADPVRLPAAPPQRAAGRLAGRVVHVDRFGNLVTDIPADWLPAGPCRAEVGGRATTRRATHYAEIPPGEAALLPGSLGTLEMAAGGADLAALWRVARGAEVKIEWGGTDFSGASGTVGAAPAEVRLRRGKERGR